MTPEQEYKKTILPHLLNEAETQIFGLIIFSWADPKLTQDSARKFSWIRFKLGDIFKKEHETLLPEN
jgi:hypothetical protein